MTHRTPWLIMGLVLTVLWACCCACGSPSDTYSDYESPEYPCNWKSDGGSDAGDAGRVTRQRGGQVVDGVRCV